MDILLIHIIIQLQVVDIQDLAALRGTLLASLQIQLRLVFLINIIVSIMMCTIQLVITTSHAIMKENVLLTITQMDLEQHAAPSTRDKLLGIYKNL